ncbi:uncharacterized protein LOC132309135 [Cornus florida]|uniref:uncharacterized protein LOC132309135 n=1 Tax=Cornus florida TaxID=4283 RepID=UPI0028999AB7|nr:uncharacterized protein LOC132309135 [Cornus florida]
MALIRFDKTDLLRVQTPHKDPLVISLMVSNCLVKRVLVDPGSSTNIIMKVAFEQLMVGFDGKRVEPIGVVELPVCATRRNLKENFVIVDVHLFYNLLMGRRSIHRVQGVLSTLHQVMRCLSPDGNEVIEIHGDQVVANECYAVTRKVSGKANTIAYLASPK